MDGFYPGGLCAADGRMVFLDKNSIMTFGGTGVSECWSASMLDFLSTLQYSTTPDLRVI